MGVKYQVNISHFATQTYIQTYLTYCAYTHMHTCTHAR